MLILQHFKEWLDRFTTQVLRDKCHDKGGKQRNRKER